MPRSFLGRRFDQIKGAVAGGSHRWQRRSTASRFLEMEALEERALLASIAPSAVITSTPAGADFSYNIALTNTAASTSPIGTFWFAWIPGQDYLKTMPISEAPPPGWSVGTVSHDGATDGYAIQFVASSAANDIQPGSTLNFGFVSADTPAEVEGNSAFFPSTPVLTSFVYGGAPFSTPSDQFVVTVPPPTLSSISVTPATPSVAAGLTEQFMATGTFSDNSTENITNQVTWASANTSVATISSAAPTQGLARGIALGTSTITASFDGINGTTVLTVNPPVLESLSVTPSNPFGVIGHSTQFTAEGSFSNNTMQDVTSQVNWASSATAVATISNAAGSQGLASDLAKGTSTISASLDGQTASTTLSVTPALTSIAITPGNPSIPKGDTGAFTATGTFADNSTENLSSEVTWSSSNTGVVTISNTGAVAALGVGTSTISAAFEGITGTTVLTVSPAVLVSITVSPANPSVFPGTADQFTASGLFSDNTTQNITSEVAWSAANPAVATISATGLASATGAGSSTIVASLDGLTGGTTLAVSPPLVKLMTVTPTIKRHKVTKVVLTFSGALEADLEKNKLLYNFIIAGKKNLFTARNAMTVKVSKATANSPESVTLTPRTALMLTKPLELVINGLPATGKKGSVSGLKDSFGRFIDGDQDGQPGGNAVALITKNGATIQV